MKNSIGMFWFYNTIRLLFLRITKRKVIEGGSKSARKMLRSTYNQEMKLKPAVVCNNSP